MPYMFGDFARDLPAQVKSLRVRIGHSEVNCFQREMEIFKNLRQLHLLTKIRWSEGSGGPLISPTCHTELKEVAFDGFHGTSEEIEFALYILRSAMVLERMFLSQRFRCYSGFGKWKNMFVTFDERRKTAIQR
ncbi:hypothetical protein RND71_010801 [Anisodus tanguticus]|uniref:FBD domain-containing protein n=1 Tax=Anisodus tanguticus TaxID=243964 RepID=A0AAE1SKI1_9SOLA|nr:hypothetical protein RND71_010801 [Anisodus tanguticus]